MKLPQMVILAGGPANRLRPITEKIPKSMVEIEGKPFLNYQLELLKKSGFKEIVLCVGYLHEKIENYFGDGGKIGLELKYSVEKELLGTAGALKAASPVLRDEFFVMYGDSYLPIDFLEVDSVFKKALTPALVVVYKNMNKYDNSNMVVRNGMVELYDKKKQTKEMVYIDAGISVLDKKVLDQIPAGRPYDLSEVYQNSFWNKQH